MTKQSFMVLPETRDLRERWHFTNSFVNSQRVKLGLPPVPEPWAEYPEQIKWNAVLYGNLLYYQKISRNRSIKLKNCTEIVGIDRDQFRASDDESVEFMGIIHGAEAYHPEDRLYIAITWHEVNLMRFFEVYKLWMIENCMVTRMERELEGVNTRSPSNEPR